MKKILPAALLALVLTALATYTGAAVAMTTAKEKDIWSSPWLWISAVVFFIVVLFIALEAPWRRKSH